MNKTLEFFKTLNTIPRPSGHEEKINNFLINFAKEKNLEYLTDETLNVVIKKKTNCNNNKTLILQAHQDMVCEKNGDVDINFLTDEIKTEVVGDFLKAKGTTLGADNGVGLSMILSILDDDKLKIPNLECVFTTQEETTMLGALNLNCSTLSGKHLLSIDGTDEGKIEVSSAGMVVMEVEKQFETKKENNKQLINFSLTGLRGGHSGAEINTDRQNSIKLMFEFLKELNTPLYLVSACGGGKSNAIPRECVCSVLAYNIDKKWLKNTIKKFIKKYKHIENNIKLEFKTKEINENKSIECLSFSDSNKILNYVYSYKNGVLVWDENNKEFPIVSNNFANINLENGKLKIILSLRSSKTKLEEDYLKIIKNQTVEIGLNYKEISSAPFFEKKENSYLQELCVKTYEKTCNKKAEIHDVHAGLEGGVFAKKIKDVDICVIAPNIYDCHSPQERVSLSSIERVYSWLEKIVEEFLNFKALYLFKHYKKSLKN